MSGSVWLYASVTEKQQFVLRDDHDVIVALLKNI